MIKFFRQIRYQLMSENGTDKSALPAGRYFKYAIGEIVLVVIGILIALQINNWNQDRINIKKERQFLHELMASLNEDTSLIESCKIYNNTKLRTLDSTFYYLALMKNDKSYGKTFSSYLPILTDNKSFYPSKAIFDGIVSTGQIELITSLALRKDIARYYDDHSLSAVQEQLKINSQRFLDITTTKMINKEMTRFFTKQDFDVAEVEELSLHKDPEILAKLFVMLNKTREHNQRIMEMQLKIDQLKLGIQQELDDH